MKRVTASLKRFTLLTLIILLFCFALSIRESRAAEPIRIGTVLSLTGWAGFIGTPQKEAITVWFEDINRKGGLLGRPVELYMEDDKSSPTSAVIAATKLIRDKNVSVLVGTSLPDTVMAIIPVCEQEKVPFVGVAPVVTPLKKWYFMVGPGEVRPVERIVDFAVNSLGAKRIALFHDSTNYGMSALPVYYSTIKKHPGAAFVVDERFEATDTNMVPQLTKIKAANPDLIILHTTGALAAIVAKNYKQLGMTTQVFGTHGVPDPHFLQMAGSTAEENNWLFVGSKIAMAESLPSTDLYRKNLYDPMKKLLKDKYGEKTQLTLFHGVICEGIIAVAEGIRAAGSDDRAAIRDAIETKVKIPEGFNGYALQFKPDDHIGAPRDTMPIMMIRNGAYVGYKR
jgi:branched-chain amino acid transport system substrate-binding protein